MVTPGVTTAWLADLEAPGQRVATRRRKLAAVLSFYRYAAVGVGQLLRRAVGTKIGLRDSEP